MFKTWGKVMPVICTITLRIYIPPKVSTLFDPLPNEFV